MTSTVDDPVVGRAVHDDETLAALRRWVPQQRWFPAKGTVGELDRVAVVELTDPAGPTDGTAGALVALHLLRLPSGGILQVPVVSRPDDGRGGPAVIGTIPGDASSTPARVLVDGCHDPAFWRAWLAAARTEGGAAGGASGGAASAATDLTGARVLTGEQSNTSVLLPGARPPAILKVFRGVGVGPNPDVDVPLALARVGWHGVPRPLAWLAGSWPAAGGSARQVGHLGVLSELVVGAQDGFELACDHAGTGRDFGELAEDLGRTTAQMHRALRAALPIRSDAGGSRTAPDGAPDGAPDAPPDVVGVLRRRAGAAIAAAPVLGDRVDAIDGVLAAVDHVVPTLPPLQRVHGDFHLGQVLRSADRGWSVLDFEGEPQAPAAERTRPDLALRDVAGMLRSIDYAAAVGRASSPRWALDARRRLVTGYQGESDPDAARGGLDPTTDVLLRALELDKALYEVVYESRNRPTWLTIPLTAVDRLLTPTP